MQAMGEMSRDDAKQRIHEVGLRATAPRVAVLRLLAAAETPLSHSEVVEAIGTDNWDQATLYRNLLKLVDVDLARVASKVSGVTRYEARGDDDSPHLHPHFACRICGSVACLPKAKLAGPVARQWNQSLKTSEMQLIGDCPGCLTARKTSGRKPRKQKRRKR